MIGIRPGGKSELISGEAPQLPRMTSRRSTFHTDTILCSYPLQGLFSGICLTPSLPRFTFALLKNDLESPVDFSTFVFLGEVFQHVSTRYLAVASQRRKSPPLIGSLNKSPIGGSPANIIQIVYTAIVGSVMIAAFLEWFLWLGAFLYCLVKVYQKAEHWSVAVLAVVVGIVFTLLRFDIPRTRSGLELTKTFADAYSFL